MAIFKDFVDSIAARIPTILRRVETNVLRLPIVVADEVLAAAGEALEQYITISWPLPTASGWLLDAHWGPYHNILRNGTTDEQYRKFIRAKRLLNRSWGAADQALVLFRLLLPEKATLVFTEQYPKSWVINIGKVDMAETAQAILFMEKRPSPLGGGFSVAGDNGTAIIKDEKTLNYGSVYGTEGVDYVVTGWYKSVHGDPGSDVAGHAHAALI